MKISDWVQELQSDIEQYGDREILEMPDGWLEDIIPDELVTWLVNSKWLGECCLPEGVITASLLGEDPDDEAHGSTLESWAELHKEDPANAAMFTAALRRALAIMES